MCGRFTNKLTWAEIVALYRLPLCAPPHNLQPRYNICPTDQIDVVTEQNGKCDFVRMRWGLIPRWWSKPHKEATGALPHRSYMNRRHFSREQVEKRSHVRFDFNIVAEPSDLRLLLIFWAASFVPRRGNMTAKAASNTPPNIKIKVVTICSPALS